MDTPGPPHSPSNPPRWHSVLFLMVLLGLVVAGVVWVQQQQRKPKKARDERPLPVTVAPVKRQDIPVEVRAVGSVTPYSTVPVIAQVGGQLTRVLFEQGDYVHKGQPLFELDSRTQLASVNQAQAMVAKDQAQVTQVRELHRRDLAQVQQAQANLARDEAAVQQARANLARDLAQQRYAEAQDRRYQELLSQGFASLEQAEQQRTNALSLNQTLAADRSAIQVAEANLNSDRAALRSAQATARSDLAQIDSSQATLQADRATVSNVTAQLSYTRILSPMSGRTGTLNINEGTLLRANDTNPLVTISQIQPIRVSFAIPEKYLNEIQIQRSSGKSPAVEVEQAEGKQNETGHVTFVENNIDTTTGTITLRADFANSHRRLWPGQFVHVKLRLRTQKQAVCVPATAVQPGQNGDFVFLLQPDKSVRVQSVQVSMTVGDLSVIEKGLQGGETVVTDGQLQLTPGAKVEIKRPGERTTPTPTPAPK